MFDGYIFTPDSFRPYVEDGVTAGFEVDTRIPYYRGIPLSMVDEVRVLVDGEAVDPSSIRFSADGGAHWFTLEEMWTVASMRWEYRNEATVRVLMDGGLPRGEHEVTLYIRVRVAYIPVPIGGEMTRTVTV
ncbi:MULTISPECIES: DUF6379 domain-containing protein [unclassified Actinomyces]|uniref:C-glycoside deglycosidase beta subunit domain-containing protein n=1 Tax=unclassified Actinomyces TaxID=2609248 RepID=UPI0020180667|nr:MULTISPECIES: DUF6379 domain-containing protein [unclassified Actinomyces]MCL3777437.1 hypothetical protein [Actinomyces sp. AC-20-1]MCL3789746.1 hypothetical protein [Actinomyces sp. 187325]MCL3792116.1 hypothetical protein [Actinomyces sp. 186855]MCL3794800.1 hypothetical protein [Actinomyces sp. 217892]